MKKALSLLLTIALCLSLCACGTDNQNDATEGKNNHSSEKIPQELVEQISGEWAVAEPYDGAPQIINVHEGILLTLDDEKYDMKYECDTVFSLWCEGNDVGLVELITLSNGNIYLEYKITDNSLTWYGANTCYKIGFTYVEDSPNDDDKTPNEGSTDDNSGEENNGTTELPPQEDGMMSCIYGEWLPMEGNDAYRPSYIRIERDGKCYSDRFGELEWVISSETQETIVVSIRDGDTEKCNISVSMIDGEITGWYWSPTSSAYAFYNTRFGEFAFPTIAERMAPYCGTWYNASGNYPETIILNADHTMIVGNETHEVGCSFYENYVNIVFVDGAYDDIQIVHEDETNIVMSTPFPGMVYSMQESAKPANTITNVLCTSEWTDFEGHSIVFRQDGSGTLDNQDMHWIVTSFTSNWFDHIGHVFSVQLTFSSGEFHIISVSQGEGGYFYGYCDIFGANVYRSHELTRIELTPGNWSEYIELYYVDGVMKNAFGDVTMWKLSSALRFKEDYKFAFMSDNAALDITYDLADYGLISDRETMTYTINDRIQTFRENCNKVISCSNGYWIIDRFDIGGDSITLAENVSVNRAQGYVYIIINQ